MSYQELKLVYNKIFKNPRHYKDDFKYFEKKGNILDVPCGRGFFIENDPNRIIGIDLNQIAINECLRKGLKAYKENAIKLPFENEFFEGIHCAHLIEHLSPDDLEKLLRELNRVLKKNGILILRSPLLHKFFYNEISHVRPYPPSALMNILNVAKGGDPTLFNPDLNFSFVDLKFYYRILFQCQFETSSNPRRYFFQILLRIIGILLSKIHIKYPEKSEYVLILRKM